MFIFRDYKNKIALNAIPEDNGTIKFSPKDRGRVSTNIPKNTAISACRGFTKTSAPRKAKTKPKNVPSMVLFLLKKEIALYTLSKFYCSVYF